MVKDINSSFIVRSFPDIATRNVVDLHKAIESTQSAKAA